MADVKTNFIAKCLAEFNQRCISSITAAAIRAGVGVSGAGIKSLAYEMATSNGSGISHLKFHEYLRFVDMGVGRGHKLGQLIGKDIELQAQNKKGIALVKDNRRKAKKIYSRNVYGNLNGLQNDLLYGYTEEAIALIKNELKNAA